MKKIKYLFFLGIIGWLGASYAGTEFATRTQFRTIPPAQTYFSQTVENQTFFSKDGVEVSSWFLPDTTSNKAVIILNGIGGNRTGVTKRADFYHKKNYNVLLPDLRGTGNSGGEAITFGWHERNDLLAAVDFLKEKKGIDTIAVHGLSLGAATITYTFQEKPDYYFVVLESSYDNIENALRHRIETYYVPYFLAYPMRLMTERKLGVPQDKLSPESYMSLCTYPTFIMAGDSEVKLPKEETEKMFNNCASEKKELYFFKGAYHENFMNRFEEEWIEVMDPWLEQFQ